LGTTKDVEQLSRYIGQKLARLVDRQRVVGSKESEQTVQSYVLSELASERW